MILVASFLCWWLLIALDLWVLLVANDCSTCFELFTFVWVWCGLIAAVLVCWTFVGCWLGMLTLYLCYFVCVWVDVGIGLIACGVYVYLFSGWFVFLGVRCFSLPVFMCCLDYLGFVVSLWRFRLRLGLCLVCFGDGLRGFLFVIAWCYVCRFSFVVILIVFLFVFDYAYWFCIVCCFELF